MITAGLALAIDRAVKRAGGDATDRRDLVEVWERVLEDSARRASAIRTSVALRRCRCGDGGDPAGDGRCERCWGRL